jgi:hypothetical protein
MFTNISSLTSRLTKMIADLKARLSKSGLSGHTLMKPKIIYFPQKEEKV